MRNQYSVIINNWPWHFQECHTILPSNIEANDISELHTLHDRPPTIKEVYNYAVTKVFNSPTAKEKLADDSENKILIKKIMDEASALGISIDLSGDYAAHMNAKLQKEFPLGSKLHIS